MPLAEQLDPAALRRQLLSWYRRHQRHLPWRETRSSRGARQRPDPYRVWVSEIMLQQTRVVAAIPYYQSFLKQFPNLEALARAPLSDVLGAWSGLGYYRRARMLHRAAQIVVSEHGGRFPLEPASARALPGIGAYTVGAILSIAAGVPVAAVDGNAARIASRLLGQAMTPAQAKPIVERWLSRRRPGEFNQALMDLGATVCLPRHPACERCPLRRICACARGDKPAPARPQPKLHRVEVHLLLARRAGRVLLVQRAADASQLAGLWELPPLQAPPAGTRPVATIRHQITTRSITAHVYAAAPGLSLPAGRWVDTADVAGWPLTGLARKALLQTGARGA